MGLTALAMFVVAFAAASFWLGRRRALAAAGGRGAALQSLPGYYGWYAALWSGMPGLLVLLVWLISYGGLLERLTLESLPSTASISSPAEAELILHDARNLAEGRSSMRADDPVVVALAERWNSLENTGLALAFGLALALGLAGALYSLRAIDEQSIRPSPAARSTLARAGRPGAIARSE